MKDIDKHIENAIAIRSALLQSADDLNEVEYDIAWEAFRGISKTIAELRALKGEGGKS